MRVPHRDNGIIMAVWFAVPGKIKHFIIVFGTNSRRTWSMHPIIRRLLCSNPTFTRQLHHTPEAIRGEMKRDSSLIRTALPFRAVADGGNWPHFYYSCLTLMISSKYIVKDAEAFKLCLSHFMALTTLSLARKVNGHGRSYTKEQCGSSHLIKGYTESWNMGGR